MSSKILPVIRANCEYTIRGTLPLILERSVTHDRLLNVCQNFRRKAICNLFLEYSIEDFFKDLHRSANTYFFGLKSIVDSNKVLSQASPLFDAICCMDFGLARKISTHLYLEWNQIEEYEDDFLYIKILLLLFIFLEEESNILPLLTQYEVLLGGMPDPRFDICKSFLDKNNSLFEKAFSDLLQQREEYYRGGMQRDELLEDDWATEGNLFLEGVAILRLADIRGFNHENNYIFIPAIVLESINVTYGENDWLDLS